jgi:ATP-dependent helicase/nuclease subunit B
MSSGLTRECNRSIPLVTFALTPDSGATRRLRRAVAERGARVGWLPGTWRELLALAQRAYLLPTDWDGWDALFDRAIRETPDAFWAESLEVAPEDTRASVLAALSEILCSTDPEMPLSWDDVAGLPDRAARHLGDLAGLAARLGKDMPPELAAMRSVLGSDAGDALHLIRVIQSEGLPRLDRWQQAMVDKLNRDAASYAPLDGGKQIPVEASHMQDAVNAATGPDRALGHLQRALFRESGTRVAIDDSVQWLGVRDVLQEAEVAAGMVQRLLSADPELRPADIGLLLPDKFEYALAVEDAFRAAGLLLSGAPADWWKRDLGLEWLFHFLYCRDKPAPAMALAICLASPLMPWPREVGSRMAQTVMEGKFSLAPRGVESREGRRLLALLREGDRGPETLATALREIPGLMSSAEHVAIHVQRLAAGIESLSERLAGAEEIDWTALRRLVTPRVIRSESTADFNLEGVTVWSEGQEPWRPVKHLVVLGFAQGAYPASPAGNAVFSGPELEAIRTHAGLPVDTPADQLARSRTRFRRQLSAVSRSATFLVPRRDLLGASRAPSESLVFMARLIDGVEDAQTLIAELDTAEGRAMARDLAQADPGEARPPRELVAADIEFGRDLLALRTDAEGNPRPESPSSLEKLMVSRLAWMLRQVGAEPVKWAPEEPNPMLLGDIAHHVMEHLFPEQQSIPSEEMIDVSIARLLDDALQSLAPFLRASQWRVEVRHFGAQLRRAALRWREVLVGLDAEILANEKWLQGTWFGVPIHGRTDVILGLPAGRVLVVDYKNSSSRNRKERMQREFDCQANLYRLMLRTGGLKDTTDESLVRRLSSAGEIGVVYSLLKDRVALTDTDLPLARGVPGWNFVGDDVSCQAMDLIQQRLKEVRAGRLSLNRAGDADYFDRQAKVTPYALDASPLVRLFTVPGDTEIAS